MYILVLNRTLKHEFIVSLCWNFLEEKYCQNNLIAYSKLRVHFDPSDYKLTKKKRGKTINSSFSKQIRKITATKEHFKESLNNTEKACLLIKVRTVPLEGRLPQLEAGSFVVREMCCTKLKYLSFVNF